MQHYSSYRASNTSKSMLTGFEEMLSFPEIQVSYNPNFKSPEVNIVFAQLTTFKYRGTRNLYAVQLCVAYTGKSLFSPRELFVESIRLDSGKGYDIDESFEIIKNNLETKMVPVHNFLYNNYTVFDETGNTFREVTAHYYIDWEYLFDILETVDHRPGTLEPDIRDNKHLYFYYDITIDGVTYNLPIFERDIEYFKQLPTQIQKLYFERITTLEKELKHLQNLFEMQSETFKNPDIRLLYETQDL